MRKFLTLMATAALLTFAAAGQAQAAGATQEAFICDWFTGNPCSQDPGFGKVIWVQPAGKNKVNVTFVLKNLSPGADYQLGIKIFGGPGDGVICGIENFGQLSEWTGECAKYDIYLVGLVTADLDGDASFHVNIKNIDVDVWCSDPGALEVIFFLHNPPFEAENTIPFSGTDSNNVTDSVLADFGSCS